MKVSAFDGGLSLRLDPCLINPNTAVIYDNIDSDTGILTNTKNFLDEGKEARGYFYKFKDKWISSYSERSYTEYDNVLYYTDFNSYPKKFSIATIDGIPTERTSRLGIVRPSSPLESKELAASASHVSEFDISGGSTAARDIYFSSDGYDMYTLDETNDALDHYELTLAWDQTTAVYKDTFSIAAKETNATGFTFKPNGTKFYIIGNNKYVYEYTMSVTWDITTATYTAQFNTDTQTDTPQGLEFNDDGTKVYILDNAAGSYKVYQYTLSTAYSVTSMVYATKSLNVNAFTSETGLTGVRFKGDGRRLYVCGYTNDKVYEFTLETPWDLDTAVYYGVLADIATESTQVTGLFFSPDMLNLYLISDPSASKVERYSVERISSTDTVVQYVYTYYNSIEDVESAPSDPSVEFNLKEIRSIELSNFKDPADTQVDKLRIYRIGDNITAFALVEEVDLPANIELFTYVDKIPSTEVTTLMESASYYPAKDGLKYIIEAYGMLFAALGNKLYFTEIDKPNAWPEAYYITVSKDITGLLSTAEGILIFMQDRTDILLGTTPATFSKRPLSIEQGCISHYSAKFVQNMPIWQSLEGFCAYSSGAIRVVSKDKLGSTVYSVVNAAVHDETYFACLTDGTILAIDTKFDGVRFKKFVFSSFIYNVHVADGILYGCYNVDKLCSLFKGADVAFKYKSPTFTDDDYSNLKTYYNVYVRSNGVFEAKIYIDDALVHTYTLTGNKTHELKIPQENQKGYGFQIELSGIGKIYEYEYKVMDRQNGR